MSEFFMSEFGLTVLLGIAVFTSVIFLLVIVVNVLSDLWLPQGEVSIIVNNDPDKALKVQTGSTVLSALASQNVYLPSACGGQGTCSQCKCQVIEGGGEILTIEKKPSSIFGSKSFLIIIFDSNSVSEIILELNIFFDRFL